MHASHPAPPRETPRSPADRLLFELKMHGAQSAAVLGSRLGISGEAARQQLLRMEEQGLAESRSEVRGVGRPVAMWHLTEQAQKRFPDTHAQLTVDLIQIIESELGADALHSVVAGRERETRAAYLDALQDASSLPDRIERLTDLRTNEGYMAEWTPDGDGYLLVENHCPICAAATQCQSFCRAELRVFQDVLGSDVDVERVEHIPAGARRCAYRIRPKA